MRILLISKEFSTKRDALPFVFPWTVEWESDFPHIRHWYWGVHRNLISISHKHWNYTGSLNNDSVLFKIWKHWFPWISDHILSSKEMCVCAWCMCVSVCDHVTLCLYVCACIYVEVMIKICFMPKSQAIAS